MALIVSGLGFLGQIVFLDPSRKLSRFYPNRRACGFRSGILPEFGFISEFDFVDSFDGRDGDWGILGEFDDEVNGFVGFGIEAFDVGFVEEFALTGSGEEFASVLFELADNERDFHRFNFLSFDNK